MTLLPPCKKVFNFAPIADSGGASAGFTDKIYICVSYDLSALDEAMKD
jgi:hypothetical protein